MAKKYKCECGKELSETEAVEVMLAPDKKVWMCWQCYREFCLGLGRFRQLDIRRKRVHLDELENGEWKG